MYLDPWMIVVLVIAFGVCHLVSRRQGVYFGVVSTLRGLHESKIIVVDANGSVSPYRPVEQPVKKRRKNARL